MFENLFSQSPATWTALISGAVALPVLIHLINLMRHKRVEWAAMEFLLKSHKKNKNWVWLKQLLLLLSRIAALLLALFMLARVGCNDDRISRLLGGDTTHHYVLLDDSFSMTDRGTQGSAFDRARSTLSLIAARAKNRQNQRFTLLRYSKASGAGDFAVNTGGAPQVTATDIADKLFADINADLVDAAFPVRLEEIKTSLTPSNLAVDQAESLRTVSQLIANRENENAIVYIVSDFRNKDWQSAIETKQLLSDIQSNGAAIELINCSDVERDNLAVTELEPDGNVRVAGIPLMMKVSVKNHATSTARNIQVNVAQLTFDSAADAQALPAEIKPAIEDLPTVFIESIAPGETESRRFPILYNTIGQHVAVARLPDDSVSIDNSKWSVTNFAPSARVLLIDNGDQQHAGFLSLAMNPGGMTGIETIVRSKDFLRDSSISRLSEFDAIFVLDQDRVDESAVKNLEQYASDGGGVAFFMGPRTNINFYNSQLYRDGNGLLPMALEKVVEVPEQIEERIPDITPLRHPIFEPMIGLKNSLLDIVQVKQIIQPPIEWKPSNSNATVAANVRGIKTWPLVVERSFGAGRSVLFTTTAGPIWNNWMRNGTFPPILLLLENELAKGRYSAEDRLVGSDIELSVNAADYVPGISFVVPSQSNDMRFGFERQMLPAVSSAQILQTTFGGRMNDGSSEVEVPGYYDIWLRRSDSKSELRRYALNVNTDESNLAMVNPQTMLSEMGDAKPKLVAWNEFNPEPATKAVSTLTKTLLMILIAVLGCEQLLAYFSSYHSRARSV